MSSTVSDIFNIRYGHSLELNALHLSDFKNGIAFVSRQTGNNGISAYVMPVENIKPGKPGEITCALSGNGVLTTFLQEAPFYTGYHVAILSSKIELTKQESLFYCLCIQFNRFRYNYGRQANKTLGFLSIPSREEIPAWVNDTDLNQIDDLNATFGNEPPPYILPADWNEFRYDDIFYIEKGQRLTKHQMTEGTTPFIGAIDSNNGFRQYVSAKPNHEGNTITVNYNGSVAEAFYQSDPFWASDDVNILYPKFHMNAYIGMFLCTVIRQEKFRYNYGRKWHTGRMKKAIIRLPGTIKEPDWGFMEKYIKSLPYSKSIQTAAIP